MDNNFTCAACGETFEKAISDEKALAEKDALFPDVPIDECTMVCDDCWKAMGLES